MPESHDSESNVEITRDLNSRHIRVRVSGNAALLAVLLAGITVLVATLAWVLTR